MINRTRMIPLITWLVALMLAACGSRFTTPYDSYSNVWMTDEWSALDNPPVYEHKYYAKGVGNILTKGIAGGWELKLIEIRYN